jgi:predicted AAA+ superfamily ATPase
MYFKKHKNDKKKVITAIQVSYTIEDPETLKRETAGLINAMNDYGLNTGYIITNDNENEILKNGKLIKIVPAYKIMTNDSLDFQS